MKKELQIKHEMHGDIRYPIYNLREIEGAIGLIDLDIREVEEEIDECNLLNRFPDLGTIFQHSILSNIKEQYENLKYMVCN
jgi:hypothetical protein